MTRTLPTWPLGHQLWMVLSGIETLRGEHPDHFADASAASPRASPPVGGTLPAAAAG
jgi:hypothetical protein